MECCKREELRQVNRDKGKQQFGKQEHLIKLTNNKLRQNQSRTKASNPTYWIIPEIQHFLLYNLTNANGFLHTTD